MQRQGALAEQGDVEALSERVVFLEDEDVPLGDSLPYCDSVKSTVGEPPLDDLEALVAEIHACVFALAGDGAVTVLHGGERCTYAFANADEADEVKNATLFGVGADVTAVAFDAQGWNHRSSSKRQMRVLRADLCVAVLPIHICMFIWKHITMFPYLHGNMFS